jgi:Ca-activated chloride channel family protein
MSTRAHAIGIRAVFSVAIAFASVIQTVRSQAPPPLQIVAPEADSFVSGPTVLRASVEPSASPTRVIFFADGQELCAVTAPPFECAWNAGDAIQSHTIRVVANLADGRRLVQNVRTRDVGTTFRSRVAVVQVPVSVRKGSRFVAGLPQTAFRVYEDEREQEVVEFLAENVPLELVLAIDVSDSVAPDLPMLKAAATELLGGIPAGRAVTILAFNTEVFPLAVKQTEPNLRVQALEKLKPWGGTALYDAIILGLGRFGQQPGKKVLVVFTDGEDQGSRATLADARRQLRESEAVLYIMGAGRNLDKDVFKRAMSEISEVSGGRAVFTDKMEKLRDIFRELAQELSAQYLLSYVPSNSDPDGTWRRITVEVKDHDDVRARQGYRAVSARP